jgi:hypothetical protein
MREQIEGRLPSMHQFAASAMAVSEEQAVLRPKVLRDQTAPGPSDGFTLKIMQGTAKLICLPLVKSSRC